MNIFYVGQMAGRVPGEKLPELFARIRAGAAAWAEKKNGTAAVPPEDVRLIVLQDGDISCTGLAQPAGRSERAAALIAAGADLVLDLPAAAVLPDLDTRLFAAASTADRLKAVDAIAVPSASGEDDLKKTAMFLFKEPLPYQRRVRALLSEGLPLAAAQAEAAEQSCPGAGAVLSAPGGIQCGEFMKALLRLFIVLPRIVVPAGDLLAEDLSPEGLSADDLSQGNLPAGTAARRVFLDSVRGLDAASFRDLLENTPGGHSRLTEELCAAHAAAADSLSSICADLAVTPFEKERLRLFFLRAAARVRRSNVSTLGLYTYCPYIRAAAAAPGAADLLGRLREKAWAPVIGPDADPDGAQTAQAAAVLDDPCRAVLLEREAAAEKMRVRLCAEGAAAPQSVPRS